MKKVIKRMRKPTPSFFKKMIKKGLGLGAVGLAIATAPASLPAVIVKLGGYLAVGGAVAGGVSKTAVKNDK
jgi:hypothetical protein